jgi:hypothetical protein
MKLKNKSLKRANCKYPSFTNKQSQFSTTIIKRNYPGKLVVAGHQRLTAVILATQEAEIRRIVVQSQPGQMFHETLS